jgi:CHAT domain-containing protein/tetratricopeptide (TPR) repeat protein
MVDAGEQPPATLPDDERRELAWALKDLCYGAWSSDPPRAAAAADALRNSGIVARGGSVPTPSDREIEAVLEWTSGIACLTRAQMSKAIQHLDRAAEIFRVLEQPHHAVQTQLPKVMALSMLGEHARAADCAELAQREFVAQGDTRAAGKASLNLGSLHLRRDAYAKAARHYREAAVLFARVGDREHSVMADIGLADALTAMGDIDEALRIYARARMRSRTHGFPVLEALVEESVALVDLARGRYREALAGFEGSRRRYEELAMPQHFAIAEKQLADAYLELRLLPEALRLFDQALSKFEELALPDEEAWTSAQRGRALALLTQTTAARESYERAATLFARQGNDVGQAAVALARAELALADRDIDAALRLSDEAAEGFVAAGLVDGHARAEVVHAHSLLAAGRVADARKLFDAVLLRARELELLTLEVRCLTGLGLAARASNDNAKAKTAFRAAIALFEEQRRALPADELHSAFLSDHLRPYRELLQMALAGDLETSSAAIAIEVLRHLERWRARGLSERLQHAHTVVDDSKTEDLRTRLKWLYQRVRRLEEERQPSGTLTAELRGTERELLERVRRHRLTQAAPRAAAPADDDLDLAALQGALQEDDALVEYGVSDDELFACVVTRSQITLHRRVASWAEVRSAVQSARFQIETLRHGELPVARHVDRLVERTLARMRRMHALVWAPLSRALEERRRVLLVPHAHLSVLPFAALHDGTSYLSQHHELAMVPSARMALRGLARPLAPIRRALAIGESSRLPCAADEARLVAGLFAEGEAFVGEEATLGALQTRGALADVVHLACHAQFRSDNPMFSALHLHDGALTAEAAETLSLKPGIVVLSGCETALAESGTGDEMVGLVRAFIVAGASRVLASLWPVDDQIAREFMSHFYRALRDGLSSAASLKEAQLEVMRYHPHPFHWGAFTLQGGW